MSISDSDKMVKKATKTSPTKPTSALAAERERLADINEPDETDETDPGRNPGLPGAERAATQHKHKHKIPPGGPKRRAPLPPPFAITTSGQILLNIEACPGLKLEGRTIFRGVALFEDEDAYVRQRFEHTIDDAAALLGGIIRRETKKNEGEGGSST